MAVDNKFAPYRYSFSGADAKAYVFYPGMEDAFFPLESLATISVSVHEAKGQARSLGHRGIKGLARGVRTIAGSLIMTVIEDHPLRDLLSAVGPYIAREPYKWPGWSLDRAHRGTGSALDRFDFTNRLSTLLPPFNILVTFVSEGANFTTRDVFTEDLRFGSGPVDPNNINGEKNFKGTVYDIPGAAYMVEAVDFLNDGIVTSVNDTVSEMSFQFLAADFKPISRMTYGTQQIIYGSEDEKKQENLLQKLFGKKTELDIENRILDDSRKELVAKGTAAGLNNEEMQLLIQSAGLGRIGD